MKLIKPLVASIVLFSTTCIAQEKAPTKPIPLPKSGVLSSTGVSNGSAVEGAGTWGEDSMASKSAPITGSVARKSRTSFGMNLANNSKSETVSTSIRVVQMTSEGRELKSDNFSYILKPGQKVEREISANTNATNAVLKLENWKLIGRSQAKADGNG